MLSSCLKCRKTTESENPKVVTKQPRRIMILQICDVCESKILKFIQVQEASGLSSSLGVKTSLSNFPLVLSLLFKSVNKFIPGITQMK